MIDPVLWLAVLAALPGSIVLASYTKLHVERLRGLAVVASAGLTAASSLVFFAPDLADMRIATPEPWAQIAGPFLVRVDVFSSVLLPFAAMLWLLTVAVTSRLALDRAGLRRTAIATSLTLACFLTTSPPVLVAAWTGSVGVFLFGLSGAGKRHARRVAALHLGASSVMLAAGVALLIRAEAGGGESGAAVWLIAGAALIRKGVFPFHAWAPEVFDHGRLGPAILFSAPQIGAYVTAVLIVPRASDDVLSVILLLALITSVYGAVLAMVQEDARRACGYLFVSQSALVMAGLGAAGEEALTGALVLWLSSGLAFAGLCRSVLVLEARRGRLDLRRRHGGFDQMPVLAGSFLLMGLACSGFPGTLGFIGEELLVGGAVDEFPVVGYAVVAAGALTGAAVLRMYFALFCGAAGGGVAVRILPREAWAFTLLTILLIAGGLAPEPVIVSRQRASRQLLLDREAAGPDAGLRESAGGVFMNDPSAR